MLILTVTTYPKHNGFFYIYIKCFSMLPYSCWSLSSIGEDTFSLFPGELVFYEQQKAFILGKLYYIRKVVKSNSPAYSKINVIMINGIMIDYMSLCLFSFVQRHKYIKNTSLISENSVY